MIQLKKSKERNLSRAWWHIPLIPGIDFFEELQKAIIDSWPKPKMLILNFPGSDLADVEETLKTLTYAAFYRPLQPVSFWLGLGSPVWNTPGTFRIRSVFNHPNYTAIFPLKIVSSVRFSIQAYRGDRSAQRKLWRPVKERMKI